MFLHRGHPLGTRSVAGRTAPSVLGLFTLGVLDVNVSGGVLWPAAVTCRRSISGLVVESRKVAPTRWICSSSAK